MSFGTITDNVLIVIFVGAVDEDGCNEPDIRVVPRPTEDGAIVSLTQDLDTLNVVFNITEMNVLHSFIPGNTKENKQITPRLKITLVYDNTGSQSEVVLKTFGVGPSMRER